MRPMNRPSLVIMLSLSCNFGCTRRPVAKSESSEGITTRVAAALLTVLADDSMRGRMTATPETEKAAAVIAREMKRIGLEPAGDSGYFQRVPYIRQIVERPGRLRHVILQPASNLAVLDSVPPELRANSSNVLGLLIGSDPALRHEHVLMAAHYDHLGAVGDVLNSCNPVGADSICNGADDDATGVVAVLLVARALSQGIRPRRTIVFAAMTGEEIGLTGSRWYVRHPILPLEEMAANVAVEMIGRPDSLAGGPGHAWLTGYERSTLGDSLAAHGIPLVPDPRPSQEFFQRSDNYVLALRGIVAHTISSFNLHSDYHQAGDEVSKVDIGHMTAVIAAIAHTLRLLADGPRSEWKPGGRPQP